MRVAMLWCALVIVALGSKMVEALSLPAAISSNMVLQRGPQSATIWGTAQPGAIVAATLDKTPPIKTLTNEIGQWSINFPPQNASINRVIALSDGTDSISLTNIAFGDVYVCSGQSNMEFAVIDSFDGKTAVADSVNYPNLRLFSIKEKSSLTPLDNTTDRWTDGVHWAISGPAYVGGSSFNFLFVDLLSLLIVKHSTVVMLSCCHASAMLTSAAGSHLLTCVAAMSSMVSSSATCYYFGRELYKAINIGSEVIPIGLLDTCWGGTRIEAWTTATGLAQCGPVSSADEFRSANPDVMASHSSPIGTVTGRHTLMERTHASMRLKLQQRNQAGSADPDPQTPSVLYNGMIYPIIQMKIRGSVWYQGEANVGDPKGYTCRFPAMIQDWRQQFNNYDMWFGFVLLAAYKAGGNPAWPLIRDAQLAALALPSVHVSSAQDLGDEASPQGSIHPRNKTLVGARLALGAQNAIYMQHVISTGPTPAEIIWPLDSSPTQSVILRFSAASPANAGLIIRDTSGCDLCCSSVAGSAFTVGTSDGKTLRASAVADAAAYVVIVTVNNLMAGVRITSVQHGYETYQQCALYNSANLPHLPVNVSRP